MADEKNGELPSDLKKKKKKKKKFRARFCHEHYGSTPLKIL